MRPEPRRGLKFDSECLKHAIENHGNHSAISEQGCRTRLTQDSEYCLRRWPDSRGFQAQMSYGSTTLSLERLRKHQRTPALYAGLVLLLLPGAKAADGPSIVQNKLPEISLK